MQIKDLSKREQRKRERTIARQNQESEDRLTLNNLI